MNFSIDSCIVLIMKFIPLGIPTAKLYGKRCRANLSFHCFAICEAMMRRMADGIPIGRSFSKSSGSLCRQKRYVSVKKCFDISGMLPWYM